jgi:GAF domain-containing protein
MQQNFTEHRALSIADLSLLAQAIRQTGQPKAIFDAVEQVAQKAIGFKLFTIACLDTGRLELERLHSSMPEVYPLSGRKKKRGSVWAEHTLRDMKPFRAMTPDGIRVAFDDHMVMTGMGFGSILNIPVAYNGHCVGTMNMTHVEGWYTQAHEETGLLLAAFIAAPLALHQAASAHLGGASCGEHASRTSLT